jgi:hypothetical protein
MGLEQFASNHLCSAEIRLDIWGRIAAEIEGHHLACKFGRDKTDGREP